MITVKRSNFQRIQVDDHDPDISYLQQGGFEVRRHEYECGLFGFVGIRARCVVFIPYGKDKIIHEVESPGVWGIENDSGDDHLAEVFRDECLILEHMLKTLGIKVKP